MTRDEYVDFLKKTALDMAKRLVMSELAASVPFFAGGFPAWVAGIIVGKVLEVAIMKTEFGAFFLYIDFRVDKQGSAFEVAAREWYNASPEEKAKFEPAYLDSFYNLASLKS